jgi:hypothetical protein
MRLLFTLILIIISLSFTKTENDAYLPTVRSVEQRLQDEVRKIINSGHLRPEWSRSSEHYRFEANPKGELTNNFDDYFHNPADTIYTLSKAYPYLPNSSYPSEPSSTWKQKVLQYLDSENTNFPVCKYSFTGLSGAPRTVNDIPDWLRSSFSSDYGLIGSSDNVDWIGWSFNPFNFYAAAEYAKVAGNAKSLLSECRSNDQTPKPLPNSAFLSTHPHVLNSYIAGYNGWLKLQEMANETQDSTVKNWLQQAYTLRLNHLRNLNPTSLKEVESGGFLYLVPELGDYLNTNDKNRVSKYITVHSQRMPYWMLPNAQETSRMRGYSHLEEGSGTHIYEMWGDFQARAYGLKSSRVELEGFLHAPTFYRGDLYYIQNLIATLEAGGPVPTYPTQPPTPGDGNNDGLVDVKDFIIWLNHIGQFYFRWR